MLFGAIVAAAAALGAADSGRVAGVVISGAAGNAPVAGVEVVLRAGMQGEFVPVAQTVTDVQGRFAFEDAPIDPGLAYLPGANRHGVHYPGPRVHLSSDQPAAQVKLTVYDAVSSPSPLTVEEYEINVRIETGFLEVTESLLVANRTTVAFVGEAVGQAPPVTLRLAIPTGFERVTFYDEFHGRRFQVIGGYVATDIPWPPGERKLKFTYRLPVEDSNKVFQRVLDLPCSRLRTIVHGAAAGEVSCTLPRVADSESGDAVFESVGEDLPVGYQLRLEFGGLPAPWMAYARWAALATLGGLIAVTASYRSRFRFSRQGEPRPKGRQIRNDKRVQTR